MKTEAKQGTPSSEAVSRLSVGRKLGYGMGDFAANLTFQTVTLYLLFFFTDVFLLAASTAGIVFFISKLWNAVCDPTMGYIADRAHSRWGKNRPFILFGAIPLGIAFALLFAAPDLTGIWRAAYALVTFLLFSTAYSVINVPYGALTANLTLDTHERSSLTGYRMGFAILGTLLGAGATKPLVAFFRNQVIGFRMMGVIYACIGVVVNLITFASVREQVLPPSEERKSLKEDLRLVMDNRPFLLLTVGCIILFVAINILAAMVNYYFKYNLHAESMIPVAFLCFFVAAMVAIPFWVFVSKKTSKKFAFMIGMSLLGLTMLGLLAVPQNQLKVILALLVLGGLGMSTGYLCPWAMIPDTVEFSEWKTGHRREGILYGFFNFAFKFSAAFSGVLAGFGLDFIHYVPNVAQQAGTLKGIHMLMTVVPFLFILVGVMVIFFYPIDAKMHARMIADIEAQKR